MEEAAGSPSPFGAADRDGPGACAGRAPRAAGGGREGTAGLQLILGGGQSLRGSSRLEGGVALAPRCPRASPVSIGRPWL